MTNDPIAATARERRTQASAANHDDVQMLAADHPHVVGAPEITHQTTAALYAAATAPVDPAGIEAANRLALDPPIAQPAARGACWGQTFRSSWASRFGHLGCSWFPGSTGPAGPRCWRRWTTGSS